MKVQCMATIGEMIVAIASNPRSQRASVEVES